MPTIETALSQTLSIHTRPDLGGLHPDKHTIEKPTLFSLHRDVHELAGYEFTQPYELRNNFILIHAKRPGKRGMRVVMKLPFSYKDSGQGKITREFKLLQAARKATSYIPEVFEPISLPLYVSKSRVGMTWEVPNAKLQEYPLLVMREIPGADFEKQLYLRGPYTPTRLRKKLEAPASAIDAFGQQAGIIHRDIKPGNLVGRQLHVVDFDVAVTVNEIVNINKNYVGTPGFSPMEQFLPETILTRATDIFAFGATLASGRGISFLPNEPSAAMRLLFNETAYNKNLDTQFGHLRVAEQDVFRRAVARHPADRFDSCTDMLVEYASAVKRPQKTIIYASGK